MKMSDAHAAIHHESPKNSPQALCYWQDQGPTQERTMQDIDINTMTGGDTLKKEDFPKPRRVTIKDMGQINFARDGEPSDYKYCLYFEETEKALVLNKTNIDRIATVTGSTRTGAWVGKQIVLFNDPDVEFAGKRVGGVRVAVPKGQAAEAAEALYGGQQPTPPVEAYSQDPDDEIPW